MPKDGAMAQISRPFQIALLAVLAVAVVGVLALRLHPSSSSSSSSSAVATPAPAPSTTARVKSKTSAAGATKTKATAPTRGHHALRAAKVHAAASAHAASKTAASRVAAKPATPAKATAAAPSVHKVDPAKSSIAALATPSGQHRVEAQLAHGDIALVLFWDPKGAEDVSVHHAVQAVAERPGVGVEEAPASAVASFGTITRGIQIYQTPTLLVINKQGQTTVLTGVQDAVTIEQAISEARHS
jgi:hypothetical protein